MNWFYPLCSHFGLLYASIMNSMDHFRPTEPEGPNKRRKHSWHASVFQEVEPFSWKSRKQNKSWKWALCNGTVYRGSDLIQENGLHWKAPNSNLIRVVATPQSSIPVHMSLGQYRGTKLGLYLLLYTLGICYISVFIIMVTLCDKVVYEQWNI